MIVTRTNFEEVINSLYLCQEMSVDTETTGLLSWKGDRLFSIIIGTEKDTYYFNFKEYEGLEEESVLPKDWMLLLEVLWKDPNKVIFLHNAKFDLSMLDKDGLQIQSILHDTEVIARLEHNDHMSYSLADCALRIGEQKSDAVEEYIKTHKLIESKPIPGKKGRARNKRFDKVPFPIISTYAEQDARVTFKLAKHQLQVIKTTDETRAENASYRTLSSLVDVERALTPVLYGMEKVGTKVDLSYCEEAILFEDARIKQAEREFKDVTGFDFKDHGKHFATVFSALGIETVNTAKGNPSFTDEVLEKIDHPVVKIIQTHRDASKRANTYFRSFVFHADEDAVIHTDLRQAGTRTGRMSCANPNLQNLSKDEEEGLKYTVRRAFIPREDFYFCMIDYNQMEFRMMLDFAEEMGLIKMIRDGGHDPHIATAEMTGLSRKAAKTLNFGLLYGMGIEKLSKQLKVDLETAREFRKKYFSELPRVKGFLRAAQIKAENSEKVTSWAGRVFRFPEKKFSYKAPNAIIQGGCADVVKYAMVDVGKFLKPYKTRMLLQIHDELLFEIHRDELGIEKELQKIMESIFPYKHLPLTCSVSHSFKSWDDKVDGMPIAFGNASRDAIQN